MDTQKLYEGAKSAAERQKAAGADQFGRVVGAVHGAAGALQQELPGVAAYIDDAASRLEQAASAVRERSLETLARDASDLGRRQPAALFAGSVLVGFALARFLKSSAHDQVSA
jgi:hypothetical protein